MTRNAAKVDDLKKAELGEESADRDLMWVMSAPQGRRYIWRELGRNGLFLQTYSPNNSDHCFKAGQRNAALALLADLMRVTPDDYLLMQAEAIELEKRNTIENEETTNDD
jgi:hypothetical protein